MAFCQGVTKKGKPCTNKPAFNSQHCRLHDPNKPTRESNPTGFCTAKTKKGQPCSFAVHPGSTLCARHDPNYVKKPKEPKGVKPKPPPKPKQTFPQCESKTARNIRCNNRAKTGKYCGIHQFSGPYHNCHGTNGQQNYSNFNWYNFFGSTYGFGGYSHVPLPQPDKIKEALNYFGLQDNTNYDTVKKKYRELALKHHPDKGGETAIFQKIQDYYSVLGQRFSRN